MTRPTLYSFAEFDRSGRVRWLLHELGIAFDEKRLDYRAEEQRGAEYRKVQPFGLVPALKWGDDVWTESGAICMTLADKHPDRGLAPAIDSPRRPLYNQWAFFACSTLEEAVFPVFRAKRFGGNPPNQPEVSQRLHAVLEVLNGHLSRVSYLVGDTFSAADILVAHPLSLAERIDEIKAYPAIGAYLQRLKDRPAARQSALFTAPFPA
jgi:glutathione S-transferase